MDYLQTLDFTQEQIERIQTINHKLVLDVIEKKPKLVKTNLTFLNELGVTNYKELFVDYSEVFLRDPSVFKEIFLMYEREDLIARLKRNPAIIVRL